MPDPLRSAEIHTTIAVMASRPGRRKQHWAIVLENGLLYRWAPDDVTTTDGWSVVAATGGGFAGTWQHVPGDVKGTDLGNTNETITVAQKFLRYLPTAALTANRVKTLGVAGAIKGQIITIVRLDSTAFTLTIVNGGSAAGTIFTLPASQRWWVDCRFDGDNFQPLRAGQMP